MKWPFGIRYALSQLDTYIEGYSFEVWMDVFVVLPLWFSIGGWERCRKVNRC